MTDLHHLNDPQFVEAARALAERMIKEGGADPERRIALGHRLLTAQDPTARVVSTLSRLAEAQRGKYAQDPAAAAALLGVGEAPRDPAIDAAEHAAWTVVANVLLNMDAALTKF